MREDEHSTPQVKRTQNGEPICLMFSTKTFVAFPTVSGMGRANVVEDPPAVPLFYLYVWGETSQMRWVIWKAMRSIAHMCVVEGVPPHLTVAVERAAAVQVNV